MILTHIRFSSAFYATVSINVVLNTPSDVDNVGDRGPLRLPDTPVLVSEWRPSVENEDDLRLKKNRGYFFLSANKRLFCQIAFNKSAIF